jgi:Flp pilus assembly pilin Flp
MNTLKRFWGDESGPELVEWAVVTIILLVAAVVLYIAVGRVLGGVICSVYCWLNIIKDSAASEGARRGSCDNQDEKSCGNT